MGAAHGLFGPDGPLGVKKPVDIRTDGGRDAAHEIQTERGDRPAFRLGQPDDAPRLPVGLRVPFGFYDRTKAAWVAAEDGRIVQLLSFTGGMADLDVDGTGLAASPAALAALGITDEERTQLAGGGKEIAAVGVVSAWKSRLIFAMIAFTCN